MILLKAEAVSVSWRWPDNVHIFTSHTPESYPLVDQDGQVLARIVGGGHENSRVGENLASRFPQVTDHQSVPTNCSIACYGYGKQ